MNIAHLPPSNVMNTWVCLAPLYFFRALEILESCLGLGGLFGQQRLVVIVGILYDMS
jgi:hypothetical protein